MSTTLFDEITHGGELEPTKSWSRRSWHWIPSPDRASDRRDGLLCIRQQHAKGLNVKSETDVYAVETQEPVPGFIGRRFLVSNVSDPEAAEVYEVLVGERPGEGRCNCKAGVCVKHCKHRDALFAAIQSGVFDERG